MMTEQCRDAGRGAGTKGLASNCSNFRSRSVKLYCRVRGPRIRGDLFFRRIGTVLCCPGPSAARKTAAARGGQCAIKPLSLPKELKTP
jgi:hypothetical protein